MTGTSEENVSTPSEAATRSAEARVSVPAWPQGRSGTSVSMSGHESGATATGTPFTTAVDGAVPAVPRCGTAMSCPPPSRSRADGEELVGKSVVTGTRGTDEPARASREPRVSITRASSWAWAYSGRSAPVEET